jgi:carbon storage regulator
MLVLSRKVGEQICVPQFNVVLTILAVNGRRVQVGIVAPHDISVVRKELWDSMPHDNSYAVASGTNSPGSPPAGSGLDQSEEVPFGSRAKIRSAGKGNRS